MVTGARAILGGVITTAAIVALARAALLVVRVEGDSMTPSYHSGDAALAARPWIAGPVRPGDVVICRLPVGLPGPGGYLVKRVTQVTHEQIYLQGDGPRSYDSRAFGTIHEGHVLGRVIVRLTPARGRILPRISPPRWRPPGRTA